MSSIVAKEIRRRFERRIRTVTAAGISLPEEFTELQARLESFRNDAGQPVLGRIVNALVENDPKADLQLLRAVALAELTPDNQLRQTFDQAVKDGVHERLRVLYNKDAAKNYQTLADRFNDHASTFTEATTIVDVEADADALIGQPNERQQAWQHALVASQAMRDLLTPLAAAATLAGLCDDSDPDVQFSLVVSVADHDRAQLWQAWDIEERERISVAQIESGLPSSSPRFKPSRCGRWSALSSLGVEIRACETNQYFPYGRRAFDDQPFAPNTTHAIVAVPDHQLHPAAF